MVRTTKRWRKPEGFTGWRYEEENRARLLARGLKHYAEWKARLKDGYPWEPPKELDPRERLVTRSQGNIGSCQGTALADCVEEAYLLKYGDVPDLSWFWSYMVSQEADDITGDNGSTLEGGGRAAREVGICLESSFPYPKSYGDGRRFYLANRERLLEEAGKYKLKGEIPLASWDDSVAFLKSRSGVIQTGLMWGSSMDAGWEIKTYVPGDGGHSTRILGYLEVSGWPDGIGLLMLNSWGPGWGRDGWALVHKTAYQGMLSHKWNLMVGRSQAESPEPLPKPDL